MNDKMTIDDFFKSSEKMRKQEKKKREKAKKEGKKLSEYWQVLLHLWKRLLERLHLMEELGETFEDTPGTYKRLLALRFVFWGIIIILAIKGILGFVVPPRPIVQKYVLEQAASESDSAKAFALQYARDYMSYDEKDMESYKKRIEKYMPDSLATETRAGSSRILTANVFSIEKIDASNSIVTIYLQVVQENEKLKGQQKEIYLKVPVFVSPTGGYAVRDYPSFDTGFEKAQPESPEVPYSVTDSVRAEIKQTLENFFEIYGRGTQEQIAYYFKEGKPVKGYAGEYHFEGIQSMVIYPVDSQTVQVQIVVKMQDELDSVFRQGFSLSMVKEVTEKDTRWYIDKMLDSITETVNSKKH